MKTKVVKQKIEKNISTCFSGQKTCSGKATNGETLFQHVELKFLKFIKHVKIILQILIKSKQHVCKKF